MQEPSTFPDLRLVPGLQKKLRSSLSSRQRLAVPRHSLAGTWRYSEAVSRNECIGCGKRTTAMGWDWV